VDVHLTLRRGPGAPPLRAQLERALREAVREGRLQPGTALPSSRALARELATSRGVVVEAYAQLAAEGYLTARQGAATTVAARPAPEGSAPRAPRAPGAPAPVLVDFRTGRPDLAGFPRRAWLRALARVLHDAPDAALGYGDPRGAPELRAAVAGYLGRARGALGHPDDVVITAGTVQGLGLVWRALRARGARRVGVEAPGWRAQADSVRAAGLEPVALPVDEAGLSAEPAALAVDALVLTPAHQFPTGAVLAPERRAALVAWARERGTTLVEDDYDAEFRYDREPVGALQGLAPEHVVYAGSASKTLAPALRLGWLLAPPALAGALAAERARADRGSPALDQLALADLLERGELDRHLRRARRRYRARRAALLAALERELPGARVTGIAAGLHAVVALPGRPGADAAALAVAARERGVLVEPLDGEPPALLLGYANVPEPAIARGVALLAEALGARAPSSRAPAVTMGS
jgi:GntR family transcriptional regulator/MocR family aminotransferase